VNTIGVVVVLSCILSHSVVQSHVVDWSQTSSSSSQVEQPELQKQEPNALESNTDENALVQLAGKLQLFVHEFDDGSRPAVEYCVLIPFDGSEAVVVALSDVYAECRDGLTGVFSVTPQTNMFFNKQGCDPLADLLSCVGGDVELVEAEIVTLQGGDDTSFDIAEEAQPQEAATPESVCYYFAELCEHCHQSPNEVCHDFTDLCSKC